jgi:hypothetical protein
MDIITHVSKAANLSSLPLYVTECAHTAGNFDLMILIHSDNNGASLPVSMRAFFLRPDRVAARNAMDKAIFVWQKDIMAAINMRRILCHFAIHGRRPVIFIFDLL